MRIPRPTIQRLGALVSTGLVAGGTVIALGTGSAAAAPAAAGVTVRNMSFTPATVRIRQGGHVTWTFDDGDMTHTTTSNQGFWASGGKTQGQTYTVTLGSAGTFRYHCSIHPFMTGKIRVPLKVTGSARHGYAVRWSSYSTTPAHRGYDVQYRRAGSTKWKFLRKDTTRRWMHFDRKRAGTYVLRARTRNDARHVASGWSPSRSVKIS